MPWGWIAAAAIGVLIVLASLDDRRSAPTTAGTAGRVQDGGSMEEVIGQLEVRLAQNPADVEGWRMLGRSYLVSNRFDQAMSAYEKASALTDGKNPDIELDLAEALVLTEKPEAQQKAIGIIDAALAVDPSNQKALWYSGVMAARAGDEKTAKARWTQLLEANPPEEIRQILVTQIAQLGVAVPPPADSATRSATNTSSVASGAFETPAPPGLPDSVRSPDGDQSPRPAPVAEWNERSPPVGQDRALSRDELRYCLAESTRIDAMEKVVNEYNQADVDTFNRYVNDYNSRCGSFRYRPGTLESVQREVDAVRSRLGQEGRARLRGSQGASNQRGQVADPTVQAVQARLNVLGYNVGVPDGVAGTRTSEAIKSFQLDQGMAVDGVASDRLLEQLTRAAPREDRGGGTTSSAASVVPKQSTTPSTRDAPAQSGIALGALREDERQSIEAACSTAKYMQGPAAYQACVDRQLTALQSAPRGHDLSSLNEDERQSLEAACSTAKYMQGPAAYNTCISRQLVALKSAPRARDTSGLNEDERQSLEAACSTAKYMNGPAAYNACITRQLSTLQSAPRGHDLSGLNEDELQSLEAACSTEKYMNGPSAYNTCISRQLTSLRSAPRAHDFSGLSQSQLQSLESACSTAKYMQGPAAYNRCLSGQLSSLRR